MVARITKKPFETVQEIIRRILITGLKATVLMGSLRVTGHSTNCFNAYGPSKNR
jgi:hypothetical protein